MRGPLALAAAVVLASCASSASRSAPTTISTTHPAASTSSTTRMPSTTHASTTTTRARPTTTARPITTTTTTHRVVLARPTTTTTSKATTTTVARPPAPAPATAQSITVSASSYGTSSATLSAWERRGGSWVRVFGPWYGAIGRNGVAPAGAKREGDGRTPSGRYGFSFFFGTQPNPGVRFWYRSITGPYIVWDDDPASPSYNLWRDTRAQSAGANPEPMYVNAYAYGAVIAYNPARTPGLGSAIFFHVMTGSSTAGCVSLPTSELLSVLRWMDPALHPTITIGVGPQSP